MSSFPCSSRLAAFASLISSRWLAISRGSSSAAAENSAGKQARGVLVGTGPPDGSAAAEKFEPDPFPDPLHLPDQNRADLASGADVGPPASTPVQVLDGDDPKRPLPLGGLPESCG